ncbi:MAG TPA: hypothetical protein VG269_11285 [Tepidisphaeraceae bacterium]|jgi:hypothetical protein|nr:hypothetical protein [Tepidisphaeraceae bacterium]
MDTPNPKQVLLPYADARTDEVRQRDSLDRAMTVRLARLIGLSLLFLSLAATLLVLVVSAGLRRRGTPVTVLVITLLGGFFVPGIVLLASRRAVARGGTVGPVAMLIGGLMALAGLAFAGFESVLALSSAMHPGPEWVQCLSAALLLGACLKMLFHVVRLLAFDGRGASEAAIIDVRDVLRTDWLRAPENARRAGLFAAVGRVGGGVVLVAAGLLLCIPSGVWHITARKPVAPTAPAYSTAPFGGDLHGPDGLTAAERRSFLAALDPNATLPPKVHARIDNALRHAGGHLLAGVARPLAPGVLAAFVPNPLSGPTASIHFSNGRHIRLDGDRVEMGDDGRDYGYVTGDRYYEWSRYTANQPRLVWSFQYLNDRLDAINRAGRGPMTQAQADRLTNWMTLNAGSNGSDEPRDRLGNWNWLPDGSLRIDLDSSPQWVGPAGDVTGASPQERAALAAAELAERRADMRMKPRNAMALLLLIVGAAGIFLGTAALRRARRPLPPDVVMPFLQSLLVTTCGLLLAGAVGLIWAGADSASGAALSSWWLACVAIAWAAWEILTGVALPLRLRSVASNIAPTIARQDLANG